MTFTLRYSIVAYMYMLISIRFIYVYNKTHFNVFPYNIVHINKINMIEYLAQLYGWAEGFLYIRKIFNIYG